MFNIGAIDRDTECRRTGTVEWLVLNEFFPLLKYPGVEMPAPRPSVARKGTATVSHPAPHRRTGAGALALLLCGGLIGAAATAFYHHLSGLVPTAPESRGPLPLVTIATPVPAPAYPQTAPHRARITVPASGNYRSSERRQVASIAQHYPARSAPRPAAATPRPTREYTIPLNRYTTIHTEYGSVGVKIVDHGPVTFSVWINYGGERRIEKIKGFETTGTNITEIYAFPRARVYYVDRISVSTGHCALKVIPN